MAYGCPDETPILDQYEFYLYNFAVLFSPVQVNIEFQ